MAIQSTSTVKVYQYDNIFFESYHCFDSNAEHFPPHSHEAYQIYTSMNTPASYFYRGKWHHIPQNHLFIIHSGETHQSKFEESLDSKRQDSQVIYIARHYFQDLLGDMVDKKAAEPFFSNPLISHPDIVSMLNILILQFEYASTDLEIENKILNVFETLVSNFSNQRIIHEHSSEMLAYQVRDYLNAYSQKNISLSELSSQFHVSKSYVNRSFRNTFAISPYAYHLQIRIEQAKYLLMQELSPTEVATRVGFYDQSHFIACFKKFVGVTPKRYIN